MITEEIPQDLASDLKNSDQEKTGRVIIKCSRRTESHHKDVTFRYFYISFTQ